MTNTPKKIDECHPAAGYSLLQLSISLLVLGLMLGYFLNILRIQNLSKSLDETKSHVFAASQYLQSYRAIYGVYPCPASLTVPYDQPNYGRPGDCNDTSIPPGTCSGGICVQESVRTVTYADGSGNGKPRVRIGTLPFRALNMEDKYLYDGYGSRIYYAVTERSTNPSTYDTREGGIDIQNESDNSISNPAGTFSFIVFSIGENRAGGYDVNGVNKVPCDTTKLEGENCNNTATVAKFRVAPFAKAGTVADYDDLVQVVDSMDVPRWKRTSGDSDNVQVLARGNIGIGTSTPAYTIDMADAKKNMRSGEMHTSKFCKDDAKCFTADVIAAERNAANSCPPGNFIKGFDKGGVVCEKISFNCGTNIRAVGIDANGLPVCGKVCAQKNQDVCSDVAGIPTLPKAVTGTKYILAEGISRQQPYICNSAGSWVTDGSATGSCTCSPIVDIKAACTGVTGYNGGDNNGQYTYQKTYTCPSGVSTSNNSTISYRAQCTCVGTSTTVPDCPSGQSGNREKTTTRTCSGNILQSAKDSYTGSCSCIKQDDSITHEDCPAGFSGTGIEKKKKFNLGNCSFGAEEITKNDCTCEESHEYQTISRTDCPVGMVGTIYQTRQRLTSLSCGFTPWTDVSKTECIAKDYRWRSDGLTGSFSKDRLKYQVNSPCSYSDSISKSTRCSAGVISLYPVHDCSCR